MRAVVLGATYRPTAFARQEGQHRRQLGEVGVLQRAEVHRVVVVEDQPVEDGAVEPEGEARDRRLPVIDVE